MVQGAADATRRRESEEADSGGTPWARKCRRNSAKSRPVNRTERVPLAGDDRSVDRDEPPQIRLNARRWVSPRCLSQRAGMSHQETPGSSPRSHGLASDPRRSRRPPDLGNSASWSPMSCVASLPGRSVTGVCSRG